MADVENACYSGEYANNVSGASWVILYTHVDYKDSHSKNTTLFTEKRVEDLEIPLPIPWLKGL